MDHALTARSLNQCINCRFDTFAHVQNVLVFMLSGSTITTVLEKPVPIVCYTATSPRRDVDVTSILHSIPYTETTQFASRCPNFIDHENLRRTIAIAASSDQPISGQSRELEMDFFCIRFEFVNPRIWLAVGCKKSESLKGRVPRK